MATKSCVATAPRMQSLINRLLTCLAMTSSALAPAGASAGVLTGGTIKIDLDPSSTKPIFTLQNCTNMVIYDLLLSTNDSSLIDPDFEGPVVVRRPAGGNSLGWTETPSHGDGVEDIKVQAPDDASSIAINQEFSVEMEFDDLGDGDILRITPTNKTGHQIQPLLSQASINSYSLFNGYVGLNGSLNAAFAGINSLSLPIASISFSSPNRGVEVISAQSSLPAVFDSLTATLVFNQPIPTGSQIDYSFSINQLAPFVSGDPNPFTEVVARANVIPEPTSAVVFSLGALGLMRYRAHRRSARYAQQEG